ncbi:hypothetical protein EC9_13760 [Rosistilla ulvae]|uniref:Bacterial Ig-like domain (Group 1) n=1 Tax=Rosistilla ulvae TaxID=1930277 RepID=A0A517LX48_9BACT|nr:carboxypeptidase-like regulatory domain-containing protein [Rosistilla ulvae]QDS87198.1 hypothetical protein EC9_13760 [Rosistilla ulvae]
MKFPIVTAFPFLCALTLIAGCSGPPSDQPDLGQVTGVVTLDGEPLPAAQIVFQPTEGRASNGLTDAEGNYVLDFNLDTPGAKVGSHQVRITTFSEVDPSQEPTPELLPAKYHSKTELTATVAAGDNEIPFDLQSK